MNILNEIKLKSVKLPDIRGYNTIDAGNRHTRTEKKIRYECKTSLLIVPNEFDRLFMYLSFTFFTALTFGQLVLV